MKNEHRKPTIYIDMDGVVADFNELAYQVIGRRANWGEDKDLTSDEWDKLKAVDHFFFKIPMFREAPRLVGMCRSLSHRYDVSFLTALPSSFALQNTQEDKINWAAKYFPRVPVNFGPKSRDKKNWCREGDLLIDDRPSNIEDWASRGGHAIFHSGNYDSTMKNILLATSGDSPPGTIYG